MKMAQIHFEQNWCKGELQIKYVVTPFNRASLHYLVKVIFMENLIL